MITNFIELYIAAFLNFDAEYILSVYEFPMTFYTEDGETAVFEKEAFSQNTVQLLGIYRKLGVAAVEYEILSDQVLSERLKLVSVKWLFLDAAGIEIYQCTTRYIYKFIESTIRIPAVFIVDETTNFSKLREDRKI